MVTANRFDASSQPEGWRGRLGASGVPQYAGSWKRIAATAVDGLLIFPLWVIMFLVSMYIAPATGLTRMAIEAYDVHPGDFGQNVEVAVYISLVMATIGSMLTYPAYCVIMERSSRQATLGKMAFGIVVTDLEGKRISFLRAIVRSVLKVLLALPMCLQFVLTDRNPRRRSFHDMMAGCLVVTKE